MATAERETWATRIGFILAAVGSAVGLGNIWRFPFMAGQEGGGAFLVIYLIFVALIGLPAILVEFVIGRRSERNPIDAFGRLDYQNWTIVGVIAALGGFFIMSFYSVVAGWVARYTIASATGAYFDGSGAYFEQIASGTDALLFHLLFVAITAVIVALGIRRGIELAVKVMVPVLAVLLVALAVYAATLSGAMEGYAWYLSPELGVIADNWTSILPAAMGQAFFTLSLGMGIMITYSSYLGEDRNLARDGGWIVALDTAIAILAGLIVFPVIFSIPSVEPGAPGASALFLGVGEAVAGVPGARIVGVLLFGTVLVAALSSMISIFEVTTSFLVDHFDLDRPVAAAALGVAVFVVGVPTALDLGALDLYDRITAELFLPLTVFLLVIFVGWAYDEALDEVSKGVESDWLPDAWLWHVRTILLVVVGITLAVSVWELWNDLPGLIEAVELI